MIKVGIVGGTGYTGVELLRLLSVHPQVDLKVITSRSNAGIKVSDMFTSLRGFIDIEFTQPSASELNACDVVFFATPNAIAMKQVPDLIAAGVRVIDLAADFRIKDIAVWEQWYGEKHTCPAVVQDAVYGLPEMNREAIKTAQVIANPGCYPTSVTLGLMPLLKNKLIHANSIIADCKSGVSGAGRKANVATLLCESSESVKAYAVAGHRHQPEITEIIRQFDDQASLVFVPHLMPMIRGIHATIYTDLKDTSVDLQNLYEEFYANEPFVDILPAGATPETRSVKGSNICRIALQKIPNTNKVVVMSVIDNLVKGAAGQAVHNMNLMFGLNETLGINNPGLML
ncbi:MAG: N-acetyl-gamma-glutamyl-phosphate reductase [Gammaproteobacteria bacterium]|nr:N-acetyl-gamma-glutamyl-phosphate reductase [Gammaproteobacteria bacterium]